MMLLLVGYAVLNNVVLLFIRVVRRILIVVLLGNLKIKRHEDVI